MNEIPSPRRPRLPASGAFVVQLSIDADVLGGRWTGRVEHVVSGKSARFSSLDALIAFLAHAPATSGTGSGGSTTGEPPPGG